MVLDRWPDKTPVVESGLTATPIWQRWFTALVNIVNGLTDGAAALVTQVAANTAAIVLLQPIYGTWTPIDASGASLVFAAAEGYYTKIGAFVHLQAFVTYPTTASGATAVIGGAPFTSLDTTNNTNAGSVGFSNSGLALGLVMGNNATVMSFQVFATAANATNVQLTGTTLILGMSYRATA